MPESLSSQSDKKSRELQKSQFPNSLVNWGELGSTTYADFQKAPIFYSKIPKFVCELGKTWNYSLRPIYTNFESTDDFENFENIISIENFDF